MLLLQVFFVYKKWKLLQWVGLEKMFSPFHQIMLVRSTPSPEIETSSPTPAEQICWLLEQQKLLFLWKVSL